MGSISECAKGVGSEFSMELDQVVLEKRDLDPSRLDHHLLCPLAALEGIQARVAAFDPCSLDFFVDPQAFSLGH